MNRYWKIPQVIDFIVLFFIWLLVSYCINLFLSFIFLPNLGSSLILLDFVLIGFIVFRMCNLSSVCVNCYGLMLRVCVWS